MTHHDPEFQFCPVCGNRLDFSKLKALEPSRLFCPSCDFVLYLDPKVVACSILEMDGKIVLLRRAINPQKGKWVMPGGYVDRGEEVKAAALRETEEECGIKTRISMLLGVYSYSGQVQVVIVYVTKYVSGNLISGDETLEARLFSENQIPWANLAFQSTVDALKDYYAIKNQGGKSQANGYKTPKD